MVPNNAQAVARKKPLTNHGNPNERRGYASQRYRTDTRQECVSRQGRFKHIHNSYGFDIVDPEMSPIFIETLTYFGFDCSQTETVLLNDL